jgi:DNA-binding response OmpR family regulator
MPPKILIVDDEMFIRQLILQSLEDLEDQGVELLTAENGKVALEMIQEEKPDLVFLDVMMPAMNGFDVCRTIKRDLALDTYVIMLTAKGQEFDKQRGEEVGADIYMTKPFDPDDLLHKAQHILKM